MMEKGKGRKGGREERREERRKEEKERGRERRRERERGREVGREREGKRRRGREREGKRRRGREREGKKEGRKRGKEGGGGGMKKIKLPYPCHSTKGYTTIKLCPIHYYRNSLHSQLSNCTQLYILHIQKCTLAIHNMLTRLLFNLEL